MNKLATAISSYIDRSRLSLDRMPGYDATVVASILDDIDDVLTDTPSPMAADDVRQILADACRDAGSAKAWAAAHGCSPAYVGEALAGTRDLGPKILGGLGVEKVVGYRRMG